MEDELEKEENLINPDYIKQIDLKMSEKLFDECTEVTFDELGNKIKIVYLDENYNPTKKELAVNKRIKRID